MNNLNEQAARALAELESLKIDPSRLEPLTGYPVMIGGFGTVRVAKFVDHIVAIKELRITGADAERARFSMRFARELKVWAPLDHPNLLNLWDFYTDPEMSIAQFICPYYAHGHIRSYIDANKPDRTTRLQLAEDTARGLQHLHELHISHGDLKELNVLVEAEPRALLCDFGLVRMMDPDGGASGLTTTGMPLSVRFASPEILNGSRPDILSDIWAWGCLFLKIVADIGPYDGTTDVACMFKIARGEMPADVSSLSIAIPLRNMLERCWDQQPISRGRILQCINIVESVRLGCSVSSVKHRDLPLRKTVFHLQFSIAVFQSSVITLEDSRFLAIAAFSLNDSLLASESEDSTVHIWDIVSGTKASMFSCVGIYGCELQIWDAIPETAPTSTASHNLWEKKRSIETDMVAWTIALSHDGSRIATSFKDGRVVIWDATSGRELLILENGGASEIALSSDGTWLATSGSAVLLRNVPSGETPRVSPRRPAAVLERETLLAGSASFSPNGSWLVSGSNDGTIRLWDVPTWTCSGKISGDQYVTWLAFSPDSAQLASMTDTGRLKMWDSTSGRLIFALEGHNGTMGRVPSATFSSNGRRITSVTMGGTLYRWEWPSSILGDHDVL